MGSRTSRPQIRRPAPQDQADLQRDAAHAVAQAAAASAAMGDSERARQLLSMINPISHGDSPADIATYRVEPYVVAADVYGVAPHTGRGGWTPYTGSAGWMYRLIVESPIGIHLEVDKLRFAPRLPAAWTRFKLHYRYRETFYHITIHNHGPAAIVCRIALDGHELADDFITLIDDHQPHEVHIEMRPPDPVAHHLASGG